MASKVVGRDVSVYAVGGRTYIGRWESFEATITKKWSDVTSSDGVTDEKRKLLDNVRAVCKGWIDIGGSGALELAIAYDEVTVVFTEINSGKTMSAVLGIEDAGATFGQENGKDTLNLMSIGLYNGAFPFTYI